MKQTIRSPPKARLLTACLLLFSLFFVHQSCTKINTDVPRKLALTDAEVTQKFFNVPANAPLAAKRLSIELKRRNDSLEFVREFVKNNGYPVWAKAMLPVEHPVTNTSFSDNVAAEDTVIIVPVVPQGQAVVGSFIKAFLSGNVNVSLYRGSDYSAYSFNNVPADSINADKAAIQIMVLNNYVFGYKDFSINDDRLFLSIAPNPNHRQRIASIRDTGAAHLMGEALCTNVCIAILCNICEQMSCPLTTITCLTSCETIGPSNPGGDPTTGGGGGSGGGAGSFPCAGSQGKTIAVANPCGPANPPPVVPITTPKPPCEKVGDFMNNPEVKSRYQIIREYKDSAFEAGINFFNDGTGLFFSGKDQPNHSVQMSTYPVPCAGSVHSHDSGAFSIFSLADIENILNNTDKFSLESATFGIVAPDGTIYVMTIQDPYAFATTFYQDFYEPYTLKERENFYKRYIDKTILPGADTEKGFLQFAESWGMGIGLVKYDKNDIELTNPINLTLEGAGNAQHVVPTPCY
jgi:hypothetical protein